MSDDQNKRQDDVEGDMAGDPQRGGRPSANQPEPESGDARPADESARDAIPSRSFNL
jgi:hypothetical protein